MNVFLILCVTHLLAYYAGKNAFKREAQGLLSKFLNK